MERFVVVNWAVICVYILLLVVVSGVPYHDSHQLSRDGGNGEIKDSSYASGLRLGRRKRNSGNDVYENLQREELAMLLKNTFKDSPWSDVLTSNDGKRRHVVRFTPRLGRESGEELVLGGDENRWLQEPVMSEEALYQRSPPFAPRLGRHSPFYPRLGRDNDKMSFS